MNLFKFAMNVSGYNRIHKITSEILCSMKTPYFIDLNFKMPMAFSVEYVTTGDFNELIGLSSKRNCIYVNPGMVKVICNLLKIKDEHSQRLLIKSLLLHEVGHLVSLQDGSDLVQQIRQMDEGFSFLFGLSSKAVSLLEDIADNYVHLHGTKEESNMMKRVRELTNKLQSLS